jgi:uncharacterized membrane protein
MFIPLYFITMPVFFAIDMIWLGFVAKNLYAQHLGFLMKTNVNWVAAILFYMLFIAGLVTFVIAPSLDKHSWVNALLLGAFFGLVSYATYDLTNLATIKDWPLLITSIDLVWGTVLSAAVSVIAYFIATKFGV